MFEYKFVHFVVIIGRRVVQYIDQIFLLTSRQGNCEVVRQVRIFVHKCTYRLVYIRNNIVGLLRCAVILAVRITGGKLFGNGAPRP